MNIRSLLLGSAAAMVAVSGAQAADAIVVEPEPVEYVRVCDAYGAGFFFIPGTETCLRFSGFIRATMGHVDTETTNAATGALVGDVDGTDVTGTKSSFVTRARLDIDTRNETDWGTLRGLLRLESGDSNDPSATQYRADVAMISIAGFRFGQNGGNYFSGNGGGAGVNLGAITFNTDGFDGFDDSMFVDYTYSIDGLSITAGVENPTNANLAASAFNGVGGLDTGNKINYYAGFNYSADWGTFAATAAHDSSAVEIGTAGLAVGDEGGWAYKVALQLDLSEFVPGGQLTGYYYTDGDYNTRYVGVDSPLTSTESVWGISGQANLTDELQFIALYSHAEGGLLLGTPTAVGFGNSDGDADIYTVGLNWTPSAAPGFSVRMAYSRQEVDNFAAIGATVDGAAGDFRLDSETDAFEITVRRNF